MNILELLDKKIEELKVLADNDKDKILLEEEKKIVQDCMEALKDDDELYNYDFSSIINVLNMENITIEDLERYINEIKQVIEVRKVIFTINFSEEQNRVRNELNNNLDSLDKNLDERIKTINENNSLKSEVNDLESMKDILLNNGKKKYYTDTMFDAFYKQFDFDSMSDDDFESIVDLFNNTKNFKGKSHKEKENLDDVINLFKEFLPAKEFEIKPEERFSGLFDKLIHAYENEICSNIDLDNARDILSFYKEKGIINNFSRESLLMICIYANSEYVKKLYNEVMNNYPNEIEKYYEKNFATAWVNEESYVKKQPFRTSKKHNKERKNKTLYSMCHGVSNNEIRDNIKLLNDHSYMFVEKYNVDNIGAHINTITRYIDDIKKGLKVLETLNSLIVTHNWILKKNLELLNTFNIGQIYRIPVSTIGRGDLENKIHLAIELGLLNPPMDKLFKEYDKDITTNEKFVNLNSQQGINNNTIRNYFARNTAVLASTDINSYGYLFYKLRELGYVDFYNYFFSDRHTGDKATSDINEDMSKLYDKDDLISSVFVNDLYNISINRYDEYDNTISNYNEESKSQDEENDYYDKSILEDDLIKELEAKYRINDTFSFGVSTLEYPNEFVYKIGDTLISRFKVLKNASILKNKYGYLDRDMLLSSIVRNSFLTKEAFSQIKETIEERNVLL